MHTAMQVISINQTVVVPINVFMLIKWKRVRDDLFIFNVTDFCATSSS